MLSLALVPRKQFLCHDLMLPACTGPVDLVSWTRNPVAGFNTKLSSAGLVYKHFGQEIVAGLMGKPVADPAVRTVYLAVYRQFMEAIDAIDNGALTALPRLESTL
jgi:uncharacterized UPF0160 family protein